jgi:hypothetical protein
MPIGSSKIGVLGAGLVPGGTETFNAPGTFSIPPGVKVVSITGVGGSGNPGTSGTAGNPGNLGSGGTGGRAPSPPGFLVNGGGAYAGFCGDFAGVARNSFPCGPKSGVNGQNGSAGSAGSAGNSGQPSSGLGNTFPGGAAGNAGTAGNAGNAGNAGAGGNCATPNLGGNGGTGGGNGGAFIGTVPLPIGGAGPTFGGSGGGGAGATNDGAQGIPVTAYNASCLLFAPPNANRWFASRGGKGGNTSNYSGPFACAPIYRKTEPMQTPTSPTPTNMTGGNGGNGAGYLGGPGQTLQSSGLGGGTAIASSPAAPSSGTCGTYRQTGAQPGVALLSPYPLANPASQALRSGGGGASGGRTGGGGGGRGNAGNAGGSGGAGGTGGAGAPQTFNCVPVTPGCTAPITVGTPGGQIVISWNPQ